MNSLTRIAAGVAIASALTLGDVATVLTDQSAPVNVPGIDKPVVVVTGEIRGNETWISSNLR